MSKPKILQLLGDWKWTGPADPVLSLTLQLRQAGLEVFLGCGVPPDHCNPKGTLRDRAMKLEVPLVPGLDLKRPKSLFGKIESVGRCVPLLREFIRENAIDIVHVNASYDHLLAAAAIQRLPSRPILVRTDHKAVPLRASLANRFLMKHLTDACLTYSHRALQENRVNFASCGVEMARISPSVDLVRFREDSERLSMRRELGIAEDDVVAGIVARVQTHRKFDLLWKAAEAVCRKFSRVKFLVVGRGTQIHRLAIQPVQRMGLTDRILFPGYRDKDFVPVISCFDMKVFLVPGSDGSCRAVREIMAMGRPVIAMKKAILPEIVEHGKTGLLIDESAEELADAISLLAVDHARRKEMGKAARIEAERRFDPEIQKKEVMDFYSLLLGNPKPQGESG